MAERTNAPVLKTGEQKCSVGSNPTLSANIYIMITLIIIVSLIGFYGGYCLYEWHLARIIFTSVRGAILANDDENAIPHSYIYSFDYMEQILRSHNKYIPNLSFMHQYNLGNARVINTWFDGKPDEWVCRKIDTFNFFAKFTPYRYYVAVNRVDVRLISKVTFLFFIDYYSFVKI